MHDIKTRQTRKDIKTLDKTVDLSHHLQNATIRTKEQTESPEHGDYVGEARDKVQDTVKSAGNSAVRAAGRAGKESVRKIRAGRSSTEGSETKTGTGESGSDTRAGEKNSASGNGPEKGANAAKDAAAKKRKQPVPQREPAAVNVASPMRGTSTESLNRSLSSVSRQVRSVEKTGNGTIKTVPRSIKTAGRTAKTTGQAAKGAVKAAQRTAQAVNNARQAAKVAKASVRLTVKMAKLAVKASAAIVRGLLALVGMGVPGLILIVIVIAAAALIASPFGLLFSGDNTDSGVQSVSSVVQQVDTEFNQKISDIEQSNPHDSVNIQYVGSADNTRVDNWLDVLAVFAVKTATNSQDAMDVATLDTTRVGLLKDVFWDMNQIDYHVDTASSSASGTDSGSGSSANSQPAVQRVLTVTVTSKTADQQATGYGFTADQKSMVDQLLSSDCRQMLLELLGKGGGDGLTSDQLQDIENNLPESGVGSDVVRLALTRLGDPYSQILAGQENYTDCSYLVQLCYKQVGISLPRTAAEQAEYCVEHNLTVSKDNLEPGDLVFWSFEQNGRYMNVTHVGIYAGNGKVIDASSTHDAVMYRDLYYADQQVVYGRPRK